MVSHDSKHPLKILILEGIPGAGKTSLYRAVKKNLERVHLDSFLFLSQVYTCRITEDSNINYIKPQSETLFDSYISFFEEIQTRFTGSKFLHHPHRSQFEFISLLETFHLTHWLHHGDDFFHRIDERLFRLGAKILFLKVPENHIIERCVKSTKKLRSSNWLQYLQRYGNDETSIAEAFKKMQTALEAKLSDSALHSLVIDAITSSENIEIIFRFWLGEEYEKTAASVY